MKETDFKLNFFIGIQKKEGTKIKGQKKKKGKRVINHYELKGPPKVETLAILIKFELERK